MGKSPPPGGNWTLDLSDTSRALYRWATTAALQIAAKTVWRQSNHRGDAGERDEEGDEDDDPGEELARNPEPAKEVPELVHQAGDDALQAAHLSRKVLRKVLQLIKLRPVGVLYGQNLQSWWTNLDSIL